VKDSEKTKLNILVVDDQPINLTLIEKILASMPVNIFLAESGEKAIEYAKTHSFAIILLDVQMPIMDGFETATLLRNSEKTKHTPIIFVTAIGDDANYIKKGYESGAVDYLLKPVTPYILKSKVQIFMDMYNQKKLIDDQKKLLIEKNKELRKTLDEIRSLQGLVPICAWCKNMRNDEGYWEQVEEYVGRISAAEFTHGICPECSKKMKEEILKTKEK
jgi:phosphoserine phosphatase RsbU/P